MATLQLHLTQNVIDSFVLYLHPNFQCGFLKWSIFICCTSVQPIIVVKLPIRKLQGEYRGKNLNKMKWYKQNTLYATQLLPNKYHQTFWHIRLADKK